MTIIEPVTVTGETFNGEMVWISTDILIPDAAEQYINRVNIRKVPNILDQNTGFEVNKKKVDDGTDYHITIQWSGYMPKSYMQLFKRLASACMNSGIKIKFYDSWGMGTSGIPIEFTSRWMNAGDFVESNALESGASMILIGRIDPEDSFVIEVYQKTIATPGSGLEWDMKIDDGDATDVRIRVK